MSDKLLTIGMCTYDDFHGTYFTIQALRMFHPICMTDDVEFIVVDNNPESAQGKAVKDFMRFVKNGKYIPYTERVSTAVRNQVFKNAQGKYCLCLDCHVLLMPGTLEVLLNYYKENPDCKNIVQGPLVYDALSGLGYSHFKPVWGKWMYGRWATDKEGLTGDKPFEIPMQGLGLFSCETKNWLGFSDLFQGFGGEEGYIHEKFRRHGGKAICIPQLKWVHRFGRPERPPYPLKAEDRVWNYFIGWLEVTKDPEDQMIKDIYNVFEKKCKDIDGILKRAIEASGIQN